MGSAGRHLERNQLDPTAVPSAAAGLVVDAARALGLVVARPPLRERYDHMLVLGGMVRACVWRTEYAGNLIDSGIQVGDVTAITSRRALTEPEFPLLGSFHMTGLTREDQVLQQSLVRILHLAGPPSLDQSPAGPGGTQCLTWTRDPGSAPVTLLVAPSGDPEHRRANTGDGYRAWAATRTLRAGATVLVVTSQIYVPFQHTDAVRLLGLPHHLTVETVGIDPTRIQLAGPQQAYSAVHYLQELNSTIRSYTALAETAVRAL
jgi:hypothetical protein